MNNRRITILSGLLAIFIFVAACAPSTPAASTSAPVSSTGLDGGALVKERCVVCHPLTHVESSRYSASDWKTIVDTMIARGAQLNSEEEAAVVSWLAANYGN